MGAEASVTEYHPTKARDAVLVVIVSGGGIISYRKDEGNLVHTLNTL